ncbi:hypothetical protein EHEL_041270 [Encephalitozoon hellem ATCC 50504]|uniref:CCAAT-binding factor domain-containing protein n=1 Tax=Encephalitozoon hellem TaxID=27973 RepID=A0A9Q9CBY0_ENCHE|nr:uncharacterized protein EHEL_041270 [Encephalitozoon hellem ATCC 50504]AFM98177.1 hypothetical protein EHEL_041270 [Encephalitozoon hellem ATCC 50504]UTX43023.1 hypothetical protein GPU96_04g07560 [Encephalitozoon hellem]WEL38480.1 hypothetical protein PFJ87_04g01540 [Encephalitozoon hellem]|eukprot:XP_003887158.1 hypothetical protein EHEL_041270 [Encephalitozoon hellem ATCC 50504]
MERAVHNLELVLENGVEGQSEMIIDVLKDLVQASLRSTDEEIANYELDEMLMESLDKTSYEEHRELVEMLPDLISCMRDPRNIVPAIEKYFDPKCDFSIDAAKVMFVMKRDFGFEFDGFLSTLFDCVSPKNIEKDIERKLLFILMVLGDNSVPLAVAKAFIKKLCSISLQMKSSHCHKILWAVLWIMRFHPMAYIMAREDGFRKDLEWAESITMDKFQPYLFELDILSESLEGIKKIVNLIRREAGDAKSRPRLLSLSNITFPRLEI